MGSLRARIEDGDELARAFLREAVRLREEVRGAKQDVAEDAELIFSAHALKKSGRLSRGISSRVIGEDVIVRADARNPKTGYDYVAVTRFGHKVKWIVPRPDRQPATVRATGRPRQTGPRAALAIPVGGKLIFRKRVKGFKPKRDWAADALPEVETEAGERMAQLGRGFIARIT